MGGGRVCGGGGGGFGGGGGGLAQMKQCAHKSASETGHTHSRRRDKQTNTPTGTREAFNKHSCTVRPTNTKARHTHGDAALPQDWHQLSTGTDHGSVELGARENRPHLLRYLPLSLVRLYVCVCVRVCVCKSVYDRRVRECA